MLAAATEEVSQKHVVGILFWAQLGSYFETVAAGIFWGALSPCQRSPVKAFVRCETLALRGSGLGRETGFSGSCTLHPA